MVAVAGRLEDSLFASIERLGESAFLTAAFVRLFEWDVDFAADSLPGDRFRLLVEKRYAAGELIGYGDILVAQYETAGRPVMTGVAFGGDDGQRQHFDADGRSVKKMFLRAPLDFTRVTSGFSHARRHPILGGLRPHLAIDYGAPTGTPVRAVADGTVAAAGWSGGNGISVTLRHARGYETMYNHLSAAVVRPGQRVRQRDVIGRVGATGLATGPHLDYRVSRNGQFVNPLGEKFIPGAPVPPERRRVFRAHLAGLLERLDREAPLAPREPAPDRAPSRLPTATGPPAVERRNENAARASVCSRPDRRQPPGNPDTVRLTDTLARSATTCRRARCPQRANLDESD